jgi:putative transposase
MGRIVLPNYPHHIVQRGHNRQVVFAAVEDYQRYLDDLRELKDAFGVKLYAFCLMTNHVHLLLAPGDCVAGMGQLMKALAARMTRYRNCLEQRSGTLWEGRYKSSLVQTETYLLACSRYIELNPVRARMVVAASDYPWSSYPLRMQPTGNWLDSDPCFETLGLTDEQLRHSWQRFVSQAVAPQELETIRNALQRGQLTGSTRFACEIEQITGIRIETRGRGRPRKSCETEG